MDNILCSILIPVYNGENYIEKTINSCLAQSLINNIEIIVVDDCSKDCSFDIVKTLAIQHSNIILLSNESNLGINKSVNKAAALARGEYILFLGHDDLLPTNHVELLVSEFNDCISFVHCNAYLINRSDEIIGMVGDDKKQSHRSEYIQYYLSIANVVFSTGAIIRKKYFDKVGGWDEQYKNYGEWLLWIKLAACAKPKYSSKSIAMYRRHDLNITNTFKNKNVRTELTAYYILCHNLALSNIDNAVVRLFFRCLVFFKKFIKYK